MYKLESIPRNRATPRFLYPPAHLHPSSHLLADSHGFQRERSDMARHELQGVFRVCELLFLSVTLLRRVRAAAWVMCPSSLLGCIRCLSTPSAPDRHVGCSLARLLHRSLLARSWSQVPMLSFLFGKYLGTGLLGHLVDVCLPLSRIPQLFSTEVITA